MLQDHTFRIILVFTAMPDDKLLSSLLILFMCVLSRTALILACENSCKEAVEILLKTKADVSAVDIYGHDAYHYAKLSQKQDLIKLVKQALESTTKGNTCSLLPMML